MRCEMEELKILSRSSVVCSPSSQVKPGCYRGTKNRVEVCMVQFHGSNIAAVAFTETQKFTNLNSPRSQSIASIVQSCLVLVNSMWFVVWKKGPRIILHACNCFISDFYNSEFFICLV